MKDNLRRLNALIKIFGEVFYAISATDYRPVSVQGFYNELVINKAIEMGFKDESYDYSGRHYTKLTKGNYEITLTDKN